MTRLISFARAGALLTLIPLLLSGCIAIKAVDTAAGVGIGVTKGAIKTTGKVIDIAVPDKKDEDEDKDND